MAGQIILGLLGDLAGRRCALLMTTLFIVVGAILSAVLPQGANLMLTLAVCRIITGLGVGGVYPLTAVASAEAMENASRGRAMLLVFAGQGFGQVLAPLTVYTLLTMNVAEDAAWRAALGLGAVPSLISLGILLWRQHFVENSVEARILRTAGDHPDNVARREEQDRMRAQDIDLHEGPETLGGLLTDIRYIKRLAGTGGTWFLFDAAFYANVIGLPLVLERMFELDMTSSSVKDVAGATTLILLIGLPGYYLSAALVDRIGLKRLQIFGFLALCALYAILAFTATLVPPAVLFIMYGATFLFSNFGPNSTTFCLPAETFPKRARTTYNGISAAMGKLGAVLGTAIFPVVIDQGGLKAVLGLSSGIAFLGALLTYWCVDTTSGMPPHKALIAQHARRGSDVESTAPFVELPTVNAFAAVTAPPGYSTSKLLPTSASTSLREDSNPFAEVERQLQRL